MKSFNPDIVQFFDTTIVSIGAQLTARVVVVTQDAIRDKSLLEDPFLLMDNLELRPVRDLDYISDLPSLLATVLTAEEHGEKFAEDKAEVRTLYETFRLRLESDRGYQFNEQALKMAEALAFGNLILFRESPLDLHSLANIALKATGVGVGTYVGFVVSGGTLLALLTVPLGIIVCGAAMGVGKALEQGLNKRLLNLINPQQTPLSLKTTSGQTASQIPKARQSYIEWLKKREERQGKESRLHKRVGPCDNPETKSTK